MLFICSITNNEGYFNRYYKKNRRREMITINEKDLERYLVERISKED